MTTPIHNRRIFEHVDVRCPPSKTPRTPKGSQHALVYRMCTLIDADFRDTAIYGLSLEGCDLTGADFSGAFLPRLSLLHCWWDARTPPKFNGAVLWSADLDFVTPLLTKERGYTEHDFHRMQALLDAEGNPPLPAAYTDTSAGATFHHVSPANGPSFAGADLTGATVRYACLSASDPVKNRAPFYQAFVLGAEVLVEPPFASGPTTDLFFDALREPKVGSAEDVLSGAAVTDGHKPRLEAMRYALRALAVFATANEPSARFGRAGKRARERESEPNSIAHLRPSALPGPGRAALLDKQSSRASVGGFMMALMHRVAAFYHYDRNPSRRRAEKSGGVVGWEVSVVRAWAEQRLDLVCSEAFRIKISADAPTGCTIFDPTKLVVPLGPFFALFDMVLIDAATLALSPDERARERDAMSDADRDGIRQALSTVMAMWSPDCAFQRLTSAGCRVVFSLRRPLQLDDVADDRLFLSSFWSQKLNVPAVSKAQAEGGEYDMTPHRMLYWKKAHERRVTASKPSARSGRAGERAKERGFAGVNERRSVRETRASLQTTLLDLRSKNVRRLRNLRMKDLPGPFDMRGFTFIACEFVACDVHLWDIDGVTFIDCSFLDCQFGARRHFDLLKWHDVIAPGVPKADLATGRHVVPGYPHKGACNEIYRKRAEYMPTFKKKPVFRACDLRHAKAGRIPPDTFARLYTFVDCRMPMVHSDEHRSKLGKRGPRAKTIEALRLAEGGV